MRCRLLIAGDGPLAGTLRDQSRRLSLGDAVEFLGSLPNDQLPAVFQQASLAVFPFRVADDGDQEGLGLVTIEAMGCGVPVIAADIPAVRDVVIHEQTGWLVPSGDPEALAAAIVPLLQDNEQTGRLAQHAREYVKSRFDWDIVAKRYRKLLGVAAN